jgi:hypothetical protein
LFFQAYFEEGLNNLRENTQKCWGKASVDKFATYPAACNGSSNNDSAICILGQKWLSHVGSLLLLNRDIQLEKRHTEGLAPLQFAVFW